MGMRYTVHLIEWVQNMFILLKIFVFSSIALDLGIFLYHPPTHSHLNTIIVCGGQCKYSLFNQKSINQIVRWFQGQIPDRNNLEFSWFSDLYWQKFYCLRFSVTNRNLFSYFSRLGVALYLLKILFFLLKQKMLCLLCL